MAIIVEDGTIVTDADSYVTVAEACAFALKRGIVLSVVDADVEVQLILASDYLEAQAINYQGIKTNEEADGTEKLQSLQWPRYGVYLDCSIDMFDQNTIPTQLKNAQMQLVVEQFNGINLFPTESGKFVIDERIGPLVTKYSEKQATETSLQMTSVDTWLEPLFNSCGQSNLYSIRV